MRAACTCCTSRRRPDIPLRTLVRKTDKYNLNAADISLISTASALHDIGKINIPASILNRPGKLTKEEFDTMKTHTTTGAEILDSSPSSRSRRWSRRQPTPSAAGITSAGTAAATLTA